MIGFSVFSHSPSNRIVGLDMVHSNIAQVADTALSTNLTLALPNLKAVSILLKG